MYKPRSSSGIAPQAALELTRLGTTAHLSEHQRCSWRIKQASHLKLESDILAYRRRSNIDPSRLEGHFSVEVNNWSLTSMSHVVRWGVANRVTCFS